MPDTEMKKISAKRFFSQNIKVVKSMYWVNMALLKKLKFNKYYHILTHLQI